MNRISVRPGEPVILLLAGLFLLAGCTTAGTAVEGEPERTESRVPGWFPEGGGMVAGDTLFAAYGSALAADSAGAAERGERRARLVLETRLSSRLESIRREAAAEGGEALDRPQFILALRKAERSLSGTAGRSEVRRTGDGAWRSFSEVTVDKSTLVRQLDRRLGGVAESWNRMKESAAFLSL